VCSANVFFDVKVEKLNQVQNAAVSFVLDEIPGVDFVTELEFKIESNVGTETHTIRTVAVQSMKLALPSFEGLIMNCAWTLNRLSRMLWQAKSMSIG
jgi:hypothetical protein